MVSIDFSDILERRQSLMNRELKKELKNPDVTASGYLQGLIIYGYQNKMGKPLAGSYSIKVKRLKGQCLDVIGCSGKIIYDVLFLDGDGQPYKIVPKITSLSRLYGPHYKKYGTRRNFNTFKVTQRSFRLREKSKGSRSWAPLLAVAGDAVVEMLSEDSAD